MKKYLYKIFLILSFYQSLSADTKEQKFLRLLEDKCIECHNHEKQKGKFDLTALLKESFSDTDQWFNVYSNIKYGEMPPEDANKQFDANEKKFVIQFIKEKFSNKNKTLQRLLTIDEIVNTLSDTLGLDSDYDKTMTALNAYEKDGFSTVNNESLLNMFYIVDFFKGLENVTRDYVIKEENLTAAKDWLHYKDIRLSKFYSKRNKLFSAINENWIEVELESKHVKNIYYPEKGGIVLFGKSPNESKSPYNTRDPYRFLISHTKVGYAAKKGLNNIHLKPGEYEIHINVGAFNRNKAQMGLRIKKEKMLLGIYAFSNSKTRNKEGLTTHKLLKTISLNDNAFQNEIIKFKAERDARLAISFINGPMLANKKEKRKTYLPKDKKKAVESLPHIKITSLAVKRTGDALYQNYSFTSEGEITEESSLQKIQLLCRVLGLNQSVQKYNEIYNLHREQYSPVDSYVRALSSILISPEFMQIKNSGSNPGKYRFWSYSLTKSPPEKVFNSVLQKYLNKKISYVSLATFLLKHKNFKRFSDQFVHEWLLLKGLEEDSPDDKLYSDYYNMNLQKDFRTETYMYIHNLFAENRPVRELISSDYSFLNENLTLFYGEGIKEKSGFSKVKLTSSFRKGGILTQGSFLTSTSNSVDIEPFKRAKWISENILDKNIPDPPAVDLEAFEETKGTFLEKAKMHAKDEQCFSCHKLLDPIADKFRHFNVIGHKMKDSSTEELIKSIKEFKEKTSGKERKLASAFCKKLISFTTGRNLTIEDLEIVDRILDATSSKSFRVGDIYAQIIREYVN